MKIREIVLEDESPMPSRLPDNLTPQDMAQLGQDAEIFAAILGDPPSKQALIALGQRVLGKEKERDRNIAKQQPYTNFYQSMAQDNTSATQFARIARQAQQRLAQKQQREQEQAQQYSAKSASAFEPTQPNKPVPPQSVG